MSLAPLDGAPLSVILDVRHPQAYLALPPAAALGRELAIGIDWLPLVVPPLRPPSPSGPDDDRGTRHRRYRARAIAREVETYAAARGLVLRDIYRSPDPAALNLGWLWMREHHRDGLEPFLAEAFRAYWALELDPSSQEEVAALVAAHGGDAAKLRAWCAQEGPAAAAALAGELRERGPSAVPAYLVAGEVFHGRQHLPMIRWILGGRRGPGPI